MQTKPNLLEDETPWAQLASLALFKLFNDWQSSGFQIPSELLRAPDVAALTAPVPEVITIQLYSFILDHGVWDMLVQMSPSGQTLFEDCNVNIKLLPCYPNFPSFGLTEEIKDCICISLQTSDVHPAVVAQGVNARQCRF